MEEKKKRVRPTWRMVHELEQRCSDYEDELKRNKSLIDGLCVQIDDLKKRISFVLSENSAVDAEKKSLQREVIRLRDEIAYLRERGGFWSRLFGWL